jgi:hypothetical protein
VIGMPDTEIDWLKDSRRFDEVADGYDAYRPAYPSDHLRLSDEERRNLYAGIAEVIDRHGGYLDRPYIAVLYVAQATA